jgi:hypothetical protein
VAGASLKELGVVRLRVIPEGMCTLTILASFEVFVSPSNRSAQEVISC